MVHNRTCFSPMSAIYRGVRTIYGWRGKLATQRSVELIYTYMMHEYVLYGVTNSWNQSNHFERPQCNLPRRAGGKCLQRCVCCTKVIQYLLFNENRDTNYIFKCSFEAFSNFENMWQDGGPRSSRAKLLRYFKFASSYTMAVNI